MVQKKIIVKSAAKPRSFFGVFLAIFGILFSLVYIINPTFGVFELLPDNLPIVGNLDEAGVTYFLFMCLRYLGLDLIPFKKK
ncbi:MAG: DUF1232 domain-containing protein [Candidatus Delongbacteria bacterium]|jgi:uncharacterized membrane protein YkvA (DUF1232 family)|nr:DUF1232 domain-containing protein [Candidatus Delongbacteria bacterium]